MINGLGCVAQTTTYFEILDDYIGMTERSSNTILIEDSIYWTSVGYDFFGVNGTHVSLLEISHEGNVLLRSADTLDEGRFSAGYIVSYGDTGVLCLTSYNPIAEPNQQFDYHLTAFNRAGNILWEQTYSDSGFTNVPNQLLKVQGGYLIVGQRYDDDDGDMVAVKVDDQGNFLWRKTFGGGSYDSGNAGIELQNGELLLLGWTRSFGLGQRDFYLVKTDEQGNEEWLETYGASTNEVGESIIRLTDGNYLLTGSASLASGSGSVGRLYKIDGNGDVIWSNSYSYPGNSGHNFRGSIEASNGDLLSTGLTNLSNDAGWLVRTDNSGDLVWQREYDRSQHIDFFYHVIETSDGGFLLSGQAVDTVEFSQDAWLLKVDSVGCPYPNCITGVDEKERTVLVDVWPNPATDVLNIEKVGSSKSIDISVFDLSGREILRFTHNDNRVALDVSSRTSGVYVLQGTDEEGRSFSMKVAKQ